jgi:YegS/Rv2252/BmrU family lipid kinase
MPRELRATLLVNLAARRVPRDFNGAELLAHLANRGVHATCAMPDSAAAATAEARRSADRGDDLLFVVGGDGTVRDAALGLAGSETALAHVPAGTVNIWAKEAGIPRGIRKALDAHIAGQSVHMDLGRAGDHCFLLMAGVGWDAEVANRVSGWLKKVTGDLAYVAQAAVMAPRLRPRVTRWSTPSATSEESLAWMVLSNSRLYGGKVQLTPNAAVDDGHLDVLAFCPEKLTDTVRLAAKVVRGDREDPRMLHLRESSLVIETPGLPIQLDGDPIGETPMRFFADRGALLVSLPAGPLPPIFGRAHIDRRKP